MIGDSPPPTGRMALLARLPLFNCFDGAELARLAELFVEESYRKGDVICREGDQGDQLYVVLDGELEVMMGGENGSVIQRLGPGDFFGETSLLLEGPRTATVVARRGARLLALDRAAFEQAFLHNAKALEYISRTLSKRLMTTSRGEVAPGTVTVIAVTGEPGLRGKSLVATTLAQFLHDLSHREVAVVGVRPPPGEPGTDPLSLAAIRHASADMLRSRLARRDGEPARLEVGAPEGENGGGWDEAFDAIVGNLAGSFAFVVMDLSVSGRVAVAAAEQAADVLVQVVDAVAPAPMARSRSSRRSFQVVNLHNRSSTAIPIIDCNPFVIPDDPALREFDPPAVTRYLRRERRSPASLPLQRLARKILGTTVGIALGGGAAFGIAHIGVLQVLEANGVPIDVLAGTSMGSAIALGYAAGTTPDEMADIARRMGRPWPLLNAVDITFTMPGLLAGRRMVDFLRPFVGEARRFEDLLRPCRAVATDIERGERIQIMSGPLDAALRASCSVPVVWSPVRQGDRVLVDGVLVDPVPAQVVYEMGADICLAVNVIPRPAKEAQTLLTKVARRIARFNPLSYVGEARHLPNLVEVFMNSMQILWHELGNFRAISADVQIHPDLCGFTWTDYHRPQEIIERGAAAAEHALPDIRGALAARQSLAATRSNGEGGIRTLGRGTTPTHA